MVGIHETQGLVVLLDETTTSWGGTGPAYVSGMTASLNPLATLPENPMNAKTKILSNGKIQVTYYDGEMRGYEPLPSVGDIGMLAVIENENSRSDFVRVSFLDDNGEGFAGNSNPTVYSYHGWRGTTNGRAVYAKGLREVVSRRETKNTTVITYGPDLKPTDS